MNASGLTDERLAEEADRVLRASGSGMKYYSMPSIRAEILRSVDGVINDATYDLCQALQAVAVVYKRDNPMRTADLHDPSCTCMRCAIDNADAALANAGRS